jgi:NO-binding membrane sensor protein with MHYT domain
MGIGIWSMHYTGRWKANMPVPIWYHWPAILVSLLTAEVGFADPGRPDPLRSTTRHLANGTVTTGLEGY